jgi:hypothetical protein
MTELAELKKRLMADPEFRKEYERIAAEEEPERPSPSALPSS